jgi:hypothetical protein
MKEIDTPFGPGVVGVISGDDQARYHHLVVSLDALLVPRGTDYAHATSCNPARNTNNLVTMMLANPLYEWLWIMGDDHCFEESILLDLLAHGKDCVLPLTPRRQFPFDPVVAKEFDPERGIAKWYTWDEIAQFPGIFPVAAAGNAGMLVKRRVFESMSPPWFQIGRWRADDLQEDMWFTTQCNNMGYIVYCDPNVPLGHITNAVMFPKKDASGRIGIAANMSGFKTMLVPPGWTAERDEANNDRIVKQPTWGGVFSKMSANGNPPILQGKLFG